ncbi:MAG TPA: MoaD/ThiS family protein [Casimicrobiaceae bacterium]|jgi:molybdopterin synthase sulfur carrier subunit
MRDSVSTLVVIRLVYLARLREAFGSAGEALGVTCEEPPTVATIIDALRRRGGAWSSELAPGRAVRFAVNHRLARADQAIAGGDEVAIFPPVTGG